MKKSFLTLIILVSFLISGCKPQASAQIRACPGIYYLQESLNKEINNDKEAFDILKIGKTYDSQNGNVWVEDRIPSDMTVDEALNKGIFKNNQKITLQSGEIVEPAWMFAAKDEALDKKGNIYFCDYNKLK